MNALMSSGCSPFPPPPLSSTFLQQQVRSPVPGSNGAGSSPKGSLGPVILPELHCVGGRKKIHVQQKSTSPKPFWSSVWNTETLEIFTWRGWFGGQQV